MKTLLETIAWILLVTFLMGLVFVFEGEPDLWDKWKVEAMK